MTARERAMLRTDAAIDQAWREMADNLGDVQRLAIMAMANSGNGSTRDAKLLASVLGLVVAEIYQRSAKSRELPTGEEPT